MNADKNSLAPYQSQFLQDFVTSFSTGAVRVLIAPVGAGQTFAIAASIAALAAHGRVTRTLILTPPALAMQWAYLLGEFGQSATITDAQQFRLVWQGLPVGGGSWPRGVYVMSIELAKRADVRDKVVAGGWDLVVVDEAHRLAGLRRELVEMLGGAAPAPAVLLAAHSQLPSGLDIVDRAEVTDWGAVVGELRARQSTADLLTREVRGYERSAAEKAILTKASDLCHALAVPHGRALMCAAASSFASLEDALVRLISTSNLASQHCGAIASILGELDDLTGDTKLDCYRALLKELSARAVSHVVVFCEFRTTLDYLAASSEELEHIPFALHGDLNAEERSEVVRQFADAGGILILAAGAVGVNLSIAGSAIHYDLPFASGRFVQREASYHRYGCAPKCRVFLLDADVGALPIEALLAQRALGQGGAEDLRELGIDDWLVDPAGDSGDLAV